MWFEFKRRGALWLTFLVVAMAAVTASLLLSKEGHLTGAEKAVARSDPLPEYQVQSNLSTDNVVSGRSLADGSKLVKRAMVEPADDNMFYNYRCKGETMTRWLLMNMNDLIQEIGPTAESHPTRQDTYGTDNGWTLHTKRPFAMQNTSDGILCIDGLTGVESLPQAVPLELQTRSGQRTWQQSLSVQNLPYKRQDLGDFTQRPATGAVFETLSNFGQRAMVIKTAWSPRHLSSLRRPTEQPLQPAQLPMLSKLSEFLFLHWGEREGFVLEATGSKAEPPKWVLVNEVRGPPESLGLISRCLRKYGWAMQQLPTWDYRITFPIGTYCYSAILGIPNSSGVAMFLATHKFRFPMSNFGSVTVFGSGATNTQGQELPSLLWYIDRESSLRSAKLSNEVFEADHLDNDDITKLPRRLRPQPINPRGDDCWAGGLCG